MRWRCTETPKSLIARGDRDASPLPKPRLIVPEPDEQQAVNPYQRGVTEQAAETEPVWMRIARRLSMDRAVGFAVLARFWQLLTGPITQLLIVFCFNEIQQGYYYAFMNLLAMQIFVELGLHVVIINVASHEWASLELSEGGITGDQENLSRLVSLGRTTVRWYAITAMLFVLVVTILGTLFLESLQKGDVEWSQISSWAAPWITLVFLTGAQLGLLPLTAILEGCSQLPVVNRVRFWQGIIGSAVVWALMATGCGLWALCGSAAVRLGGECYLVTVRYRRFFEPFRQPPQGATINWKEEILPLQWRIAIQGVFLWLASHLAGLVIMKYHGLAVSGRFGMMWTILVALQAASLSWIETRRPKFGQLIAERKYQELDELFFRVSRVSVLLLAAGGTLFTMGVWLLNQVPHWACIRISDRLPDAATTAVFSLALIVFQFAQCSNIYVRAHKRDPFLLAAIISSSTIALLVFWLGKQHGIWGVAIGYLFGVAVVQTPCWLVIWATTRRRWHSEN